MISIGILWNSVPWLYSQLELGLQHLVVSMPTVPGLVELLSPVMTQSVTQGRSSGRSQTHPSVRPCEMGSTSDWQTSGADRQPAMTPRDMEAMMNACDSLILMGVLRV